MGENRLNGEKLFFRLLFAGGISAMLAAGCYAAWNSIHKLIKKRKKSLSIAHHGFSCNYQCRCVLVPIIRSLIIARSGWKRKFEIELMKSKIYFIELPRKGMTMGRHCAFKVSFSAFTGRIFLLIQVLSRRLSIKYLPLEIYLAFLSNFLPSSSVYFQFLPSQSSMLIIDTLARK